MLHLKTSKKSRFNGHLSLNFRLRLRTTSTRREDSIDYYLYSLDLSAEIEKPVHKWAKNRKW